MARVRRREDAPSVSKGNNPIEEVQTNSLLIGAAL